jgi:glyoxylase-like metal-dependent hydrolase (beta-lactamase superfamily II)
MVDVGNGSKYNEKLTAIYKFDTSESDLLASLEKYGLTTTDITDVILTHLHFDHAGGSTFRANGDLKLTFPNAKYYVQRDHWDAANKPTERDRASFFPDDFVPLRQHGVLEFTDGEGEILPGIRVHVMYGHTTALQSPIISDGKTTLFYCADLVPTSSHVPLPWIMAYDLRPLVTLEEKRKLLSRAVDEDWVLFFEHDPIMAAARVIREKESIVLGPPVIVG